MSTSLGIWWGNYRVIAQASRQWSVGPLSVVISRHQREFRIYANEYNGEGEEYVDVADLSREPDLSEPDCPFSLVRHVTDDGEGEIEVVPALADRPVVSKPLYPFMIHPREKVRVYVSSPLWFQAYVTGSRAQLIDRPMIRPSDTWFGNNTRQGELAYASRTNARFDLDDVPISPIRAVTPVDLRNGSTKPLTLEKLCLPVSYLSLYADRDGRLWTDPVTVSCEDQNEPSALSIERDEYQRSATIQLIASPRQSARSGLVHSLNVLFG